MVVLWRRWIFLSSFRFVCVFLLRYFVSLCLSLSRLLLYFFAVDYSLSF